MKSRVLKLLIREVPKFLGKFGPMVIAPGLTVMGPRKKDDPHHVELATWGLRGIILAVNFKADPTIDLYGAISRNRASGVLKSSVWESRKVNSRKCLWI
jgi:hypothetical protein